MVPVRRRSRSGRSSGRAARQSVAPLRTREGVERDHVEERPESQLLGQESAGELELWGQGYLGVEEQFARVVAGLAVDVHRPGVVGGLGRRRARTGRRTRRRARRGRRSRPIAGGPGRSRPTGLARESRATPGSPRREVADPPEVRRVLDVDVGELMVADGEGPARERVEDLAERARGGRRDQAGPAEDPVGLDHAGDVAMAVLADDPDPGSRARLGLVEQGGAGVVQLADQPGQVGAARAEPLGVVVEVGQVDEGEVGPLVAEDARPRPGRSRGAGQAGPAPRRCGTGTCRARPRADRSGHRASRRSRTPCCRRSRNRAWA